MAEDSLEALRQQVEALIIEHGDLDDIIQRLSQDPSVDQLQLSRLKKRKLRLKDAITRLKSQLIPDLDA